MNKILKIISLGFFCIGSVFVKLNAEELLINGAGASFPYPIYTKWFQEFNTKYPDYKFNYQSIGSGGGIRQITSKTVDFGATDGPMTDAQLEAAPGYLYHVPTVLGGVAVIYNVPGISQQLKLSQKVLAKIFLGEITKWNHPEIQKDNSDVKLPNSSIVVVHRSDGSGTTYIFVDFLSKVSSAWTTKVGRGTSVAWPTGLGGKGNEGVSGLVKETPNSIGYVELIYAKQNKLAYGLVENKVGKFIEPTLESVSDAAQTKIPSDFRVSITNSPEPDSYPISGFTWLLIYKNQSDAQKGKAIDTFIDWMLVEGQKFAPELGYAPLPKIVNQLVRERIKLNYEGK